MKEGEIYELCEEIYENKNETEKGEITIIDPIFSMEIYYPKETIEIKGETKEVEKGYSEFNVMLDRNNKKFRNLDHIGDLVSRIRNIYGYDGCRNVIVIKDNNIEVTKKENIR